MTPVTASSMLEKPCGGVSFLGGSSVKVFCLILQPPARSLFLAFSVCAQAALSGCSSWTSLHAGYGRAVSSDRSVAGVEAEQAAGSGLHAPYVLIGARLDSNDRQFDAEGHVGIMHPLRLAEALTLTPSATLELARVSYIARRWDGGALGPGLGGELLWWYTRDSRSRRTTGSFGCMGGAPGVDCPYQCYRDHDRTGIGLRISLERDVRFGSSAHPGLGDTMIWFMLGISHARGSEDEDCRLLDDPLWPRGRAPLQPLPALAPR
jgi:hypothetical protein